MPFIDTELPGLKVFEPKVFKDSRGYFFESYNKERFNEAGILADFVQDNQSRSAYGVVRGLHYQLAPHAQAKLVRALSGEILDIVVDIRKGSPTFGKHFNIVLSAEKQNQLYIPRGFAHGFVVLSEYAEFFYKCDDFYAPESEGGIRFDDPDLDLDWGIPRKDMILSEKDQQLPSFSEVKMNFTFEG